MTKYIVKFDNETFPDDPSNTVLEICDEQSQNAPLMWVGLDSVDGLIESLKPYSTKYKD